MAILCSSRTLLMAAQSISFFFRHVLKLAYAIPSLIYPGTASKLPAVVSVQEIKTLIDSINNIKPVRLSCFCTAPVCASVKSNIHSKNMRIKVLLLFDSLLLELFVHHLVFKTWQLLSFFPLMKICPKTFYFPLLINCIKSDYISFFIENRGAFKIIYRADKVF